ncbi:hypothetical protein BG000_011887 [Podila horticola]|nr:hypothetical protein BG000_011887 [Podila horticola]
MRAAELRQAGEEKATANVQGGGDAAHAGAASGEAAKDTQESGATLMNRFRGLIGVKARGITKEDMEYAEALKKAKLSKADSVHPNKFLQQRTTSSGAANLTSSGLFEDDEDEFLLPTGMSYVQYLTQELEHFDKAEAQGLRDFIATHPTLDVGPREEIFLIFFFLFALREIARELLRLGKYVEELEERERMKLEEEELQKQNSWLYCFGRRSIRNGNIGSAPKARKKLWWPKVVGNFWHWFAWGSYTQVKTSEGYNSLIRNTTKNLEHREPRTVQEEKVLVEAKNAKTAAEKVAAETALKLTEEKRAEQDRDSRRHQRRHSEGWNMLPLRRAATSSAVVQSGQRLDLEMGLGQGNNNIDRDTRQRRGVLRNGSRSNSHGRQHDVEWHYEGKGPRRHRSHEPLSPTLSHASHKEEEQLSEVKEPAQDLNHLGDPSVMGHQEILNDSNIEGSAKGKSKRANMYTVVDIPGYESLQQTKSQDLQEADDVNKSDILPRVNVIQASKTAPPELSHNVEPKGKGSKTTVISAKSSTHQDRYPSFASSTSPAVLPSEPGTSGSKRPKKRPERRTRITDDVDDSESTTSESMDTRQRTQLQQQLSASPEPENRPLARSIFVNVRKPKTWRYRVWEFLQNFKTEEVKFGFKMAAALTFIGLWSWLQWSSQVLATDRGQWAMLTVMAVLSPTVGATFSVCAMRIAGTLVGTLWALLTYLALPKNPYVICAMMLIIAFAGVFLILETSHPKLGIIMMLSYSSITFIMYEGKTPETIYEVCYKRAITVIIGIIISVIMNSLLWPILARRELRKEIAYLIGRQGVLFAELVNKFLLEEPQQRRKTPSHYVAKWGDDTLSDEYSSEEEEELEVDLREAAHVDPFREGFVERAQQEEKKKRHSSVARSLQRPHLEDTLESIDPDRLAFQHVEHQLQTKLIKILQLLELSGSEPRLKEEFPMKLYKQIIQCCQNILDRMISMRMAAQLLSPEVRELVTGPMNYYRRDMVGALLLYFSVLSSSLASKSPLPPYLPSARMARLRVIYNVREAIAAHQAVTGEDHYTYIYYYAFSSALEEVIEELELLAILIKPIVGVTLVSSGENYGCSFGNDQLNLGSAMATSQMGIPALSYHGQPGQAGGSDQPFDSHGGVGTPGTLLTMVNHAQSTAGLGGEAFANNYQQMRLLQQQEAQQNQYMQQQHIQQLHLQHPHPQPPQSQQQMQPSFHPELALPAPPRIIINPQIVQIPGQPQPTPAPFVRTKSKPGSDSSGHSSVVSLNRTTAGCLAQEKSLKVDTSHHRKDKAGAVSPLVTAGPGSMIMMDEALLGGRHAQRYKEAIQVAQEASGQQFIQVSSPIAVLPAQIQLPVPGVGGSSTQAQPRKPSLTDSLKQKQHPHHHHHVPSKPQGEVPREGGRTDNNDAATSAQPYIINIPAAIVTPFGSDLVPEAPLPLHLVPSLHQQEKEQP